VYQRVRRDDARAAADAIDAALGDAIRNESVAPVSLTAPRKVAAITRAPR